MWLVGNVAADKQEAALAGTGGKEWGPWDTPGAVPQKAEEPAAKVKALVLSVP